MEIVLAHKAFLFEVIRPVLNESDTVLTGDEIYAKQPAVQPQFAEYHRKTTRLIPVLELQRAAG